MTKKEVLLIINDHFTKRTVKRGRFTVDQLVCSICKARFDLMDFDYYDIAQHWIEHYISIEQRKDSNEN